MKAMVLKACGDMARHPAPLVWQDVPAPVPGPGELLVTVAVCGVCHTELDEIEGRTPPPRLPVIPGHQIVGSVAAIGRNAEAESPVKLHAVIDTTPAWRPVVEALKNLHPGGRLVINAIGKQEADKAALLSLDYPRDLWREKLIRSVANVTRADVRQCLALAAAAGIHAEVKEFPLAEANRALQELRSGHGRGAKVLRIGSVGAAGG